MSLVNKQSQLGSRWLKLTILMLLMVVVWGLHPAKSLAFNNCDPEAITCPPTPNQWNYPLPTQSHKMPSPEQFSQGGSVNLVVARCDTTTPACTGAHRLNATTSVVRLFIKKTKFDANKGFSFTISDGKGSDSCGSQDDISSINNTNFTMKTLNYLKNGDNFQDPWNNNGHSVHINGGSLILTSAQAGCGDKTVIIDQGDHPANVGQGQYEGWYGFEFSATLTSGVGWNSFKLSSNVAYFSYYSGAGDHFALKSTPGSGRGTFDLPFAPNCAADTGNAAAPTPNSYPYNYPLHWYDADAGQSNQNNQNPVHTVLYAFNYALFVAANQLEQTSTTLDIYADASQNPINKNGHTDWAGYQNGGGGNNEGGFFNVPMRTGWIYLWEWQNVNDDNGIQFSLPFDSFDAYNGVALTNECNPQFSCTTTVIDADKISVTLTNDSDYSVGDGWQLRQSLDAQRNPANGFGSNFSAGESRTYGFSRPPDADESYTLYDHNGKLSDGNAVGKDPLCQVIVTPPPPSITARPYAKFFGADVMAGGWFAYNGTCSTATPPYQRSSSDPTGGILGYENNWTGGASSQYGAFALGKVEESPTSGPSYGFYSGGSANQASATNNRLTFANTGASPGFFEGTTPQSNCIPDYYTTKLPSSASGFTPNSSFPAADNAYKYAAPNSVPVQLFSGGVSIGTGRKVTIFIKGNVYISNNITYAPGDTADATTKFALVVLGSVYIDPSVTQLEGLYIAQPDPNNVDPVNQDTGDIWTCHDKSTTNPLSGNWVYNNCGQKLVINGAVVAKQVNFLRSRGNVASAIPGEDSLSGAQASNNIAEIINFTPEMVVGGPFFNPTTNSYQIQSLTSLPPIF